MSQKRKSGVSNSGLRSPKPVVVVLKKKKRPRPGSRACREVRQYQLSSDFLIPRKTLDRLIRLRLLQHTDEPKLDQGAKDALQWDLEYIMCDVLMNTRKRAELLGRKTCTAQHLTDTIKDNERYIGSFVPADTTGVEP